MRYLTSQTAKGMADESCLPVHRTNPCCRSPQALNTFGHNTLHYPLWDTAQAFDSLKMGQLEVAQGRARRGETGACCTHATTPSASSDTGVM